MKPLPRENTILEFLRTQMFMIFGTCFKVSSRIHILSICYRILSVLGVHVETLGPTFWDLFFRSPKSQNMFFFVLLGRGHLGPHREKGELGKIWGLDTFRAFLGGFWEAPGKDLGGTQEARGAQGAQEAQRRILLKNKQNM